MCIRDSISSALSQADFSPSYYLNGDLTIDDEKITVRSSGLHVFNFTRLDSIYSAEMQVFDQMRHQVDEICLITPTPLFLNELIRYAPSEFDPTKTQSLFVSPDLLYVFTQPKTLKIFRVNTKQPQSPPQSITEIMIKRDGEEEIAVQRLFLLNHVNLLALQTPSRLLFVDVSIHNDPNYLPTNDLVLFRDPSAKAVKSFYDAQTRILWVLTQLNTIELYTLDNINDFKYLTHLNCELINPSNKLCEIADIAYNQRSKYLYILDVNYGVFVVYGQDDKHLVVLRSNVNKALGKFVSVFEKSLWVAYRASNESTKSYVVYEYYQSEEKPYIFDFNRKLQTFSKVNSMDMTEDFVAIRQENIVEIYRHSIFLQYLTEDEMNQQNFVLKGSELLSTITTSRGAGNGLLIQSLFGIQVFEIKSPPPVIDCEVGNSNIQEGEFSLELTYLTKNCPEKLKKNDSTLFNKCVYKKHMQLTVSTDAISSSSVTVSIILFIASIFIMVFSLSFCFLYHKLKNGGDNYETQINENEVNPIFSGRSTGGILSSTRGGLINRLSPRQLLSQNHAIIANIPSPRLSERKQTTVNTSETPRFIVADTEEKREPTLDERNAKLQIIAETPEDQQTTDREANLRLIQNRHSNNLSEISMEYIEGKSDVEHLVGSVTSSQLLNSTHTNNDHPNTDDHHNISV
eukprot:TRINITY_DN20917_c0_g1_i1.p1 TRINITY_DN20917_c0_g1~~TRINITY_DN20917_c0_g1_i1.p1  ORF type:complete len:704 (-),score=78.18 TRINITY_DN20917_c0_g1_i1:188-2242(-)